VAVDRIGESHAVGRRAEANPLVQLGSIVPPPEPRRTTLERVYPRVTVLSRALIAGVIALVAASPAYAVDRQGEQWGLEMVRAPQAWPTSTGVGALVAVIDTGVQRDHPDLGNTRLTGGFDFVGNDPIETGDEDTDPDDGNGHGTHVTGIIVGDRDGDGITGVAPGARVMPLRVLDDSGSGYTDDTVKAVDYAIDHDADVINLSLGDFFPLQSKLIGDPAYRDALERAVEHGVVVVIAAGNNGLPYCENPDVAGMLCVGGVDNQPARAMAYSSYGSNVDLMAPGGSCGDTSSTDILSSVINSGYDTYCGTSQAAPHVAGVAALLVSLGVTGQAAADRIVATAADSCGGLPDQCGAGVVDAAAAVEGLGPPDGGPGAGSFSTKRHVKRRAVRRHGFRAVCEPAQPGTCKVVVRRRARKIARGRDDAPADLATGVTAPLNRRGERALKRMGRRLRVRVWVTLPGEKPQSRRVVVRR
jgi:serine protease